MSQPSTLAQVARDRPRHAWSDFDPRYPPVDYAAAEPGIARHISYIRHLRMYSPDPSTKVAALILGPDGHVVSTGVNKFPRGVGETMPEVYERPLKYDANTHGERGAIFNAAREGKATRGCTLCVTGTPCVACTTAIIESGIRTVVLDRQGDTPDFLSRWAEKCETGLRMFKAAGVQVIAADVSEDGRLLRTQTLDEYLEGTIRPAADQIRAARAAEARVTGALAAGAQAPQARAGEAQAGDAPAGARAQAGGQAADGRAAAAAPKAPGGGP